MLDAARSADSSWRPALVAVAVGSAGTVLSWLLVAQPQLALVTGVSFAVVTRLTFSHPDTVYEPDRSGAPVGVGRWSGALAGFVAFVTVLAVTGLSVSAATAAGVALGLVGVCYATWLLGVAYARAKDA